mmetsp:Transcript_4713/g.16583  ORF Transcript_4713/g.16583 Transcript_4713/m.16583 type:complete len:210 (+) Transcript_4713:77-706(+)
MRMAGWQGGPALEHTRSLQTAAVCWGRSVPWPRDGGGTRALRGRGHVGGMPLTYGREPSRWCCRRSAHECRAWSHPPTRRASRDKPQRSGDKHSTAASWSRASACWWHASSCSPTRTCSSLALPCSHVEQRERCLLPSCPACPAPVAHTRREPRSLARRCRRTFSPASSRGSGCQRKGSAPRRTCLAWASPQLRLCHPPPQLPAVPRRS